ncbi:MAG: hypothetical protein H7287_05590 [Thermoleophilia bacterium]|nr:hypothetical protein [Thermoleophilia bacterium]
MMGASTNTATRQLALGASNITMAGQALGGALQTGTAPTDSASTQALMQSLLGTVQQLASTLAAMSPATSARAGITSATPAASGGGAMGGMSMPMTGSNTAAVKVDGTNSSTVPGRAVINNPATNDPRFVAGTTGPTMKKGKATTVKLEDGKALDGGKARKQNDGDKKQNNYSVTDANYNPQLGIPAQIVTDKNATPHKPTYAETINLYSAAGYVQAFAPAEYDKMVATQNSGGMTVLEQAAMATGIIPKSGNYAASGIVEAGIPTNIPGSGLDAKKYLQSGTDITGQEWARPHHALSQWGAYAQLIKLGVDGETAHTLAGDDGVSGGGRLNGVNNQDGNDSFNAGEIEIWSKAAKLEEETGKPILAALSHSHAMTGLSEDTLTNPNINKIINKKGGVGAIATKGEDARTLVAGSARELGLKKILLDGTVGDDKKANADGTKADNKKLFTGRVDPSAASAQITQQAGDNMAGMAMPATATGGGAVNAASPASSLAIALQALIAALQAFASGTSAPAATPATYSAPVAAPAPAAPVAARTVERPQVTTVAARPVTMTAAS